MNTGRKENGALRSFIKENWEHMTDQQMASRFDCDSRKVRSMRHRMFLIRSTGQLEAMREAHNRGSINLNRGPDKTARQLTAMQIANRRAKGIA